jgi:hypothetical protein
MGGKTFSTLFLNVRKIFFQPPAPKNIFGKNSGQKKILQGIIGFRRAILAGTPLIKRG